MVGQLPGKDQLGDPSAVSLTKELSPLLKNGGKELSDWWSQKEVKTLGVIELEQEIKGLLGQGGKKLDILGHDPVFHFCPGFAHCHRRRDDQL